MPPSNFLMFLQGLLEWARKAIYMGRFVGTPRDLSGNGLSPATEDGQAGPVLPQLSSLFCKSVAVYTKT